MPTIVVPYRGAGGKQRLAPLEADARAMLADAMLADVVAACACVGPVLVVAPEQARETVARLRASGGTATAGEPRLVADPGRGQGAAVAAALAGVPSGPVLVVNADLPCVTARDLFALLGALPPDGIALAEARDGTTNALALASPALFEPLYGPGSAQRFRALGRVPAGAGSVRLPNLVDDVDTVDDLRRLEGRLGSRTAAAVAALGLGAGAAA